MQKKSLKELQKEWYQKLADTGFKDIEDTESPREMLKRWDSSYFNSHFTPETFGSRQEYFDLAAKFYAAHSFESEVARNIWGLHLDGKSIREIAKDIGEDRNRVHKLLKDLVAQMKNSPARDDGKRSISTIRRERRKP